MNNKAVNANYFKNCIKIQFEPDIKRIIFRKDIIEGLMELNNMQLQFIEKITQFKNNHTWLIALSIATQAENYYNSKIEVCGIACLIKPPLDEYTFYCYKIMWMPPRFPLSAVENYLESTYGKLVSTKQIFCKEPGYESIGTGIFNITIKYPKEKVHLITNNTGIVDLNGQKLLITRYGDKQLCLYCKQEGHKKAQCEKFNSICKECGQRGHIKCTLAAKIADNREDLEEDNEVNETENRLKDTSSIEITQNKDKNQNKQASVNKVTDNITVKKNEHIMHQEQLMAIKFQSITNSQLQPPSYTNTFFNEKDFPSIDQAKNELTPRKTQNQKQARKKVHGDRGNDSSEGSINKQSISKKKKNDNDDDNVDDEDTLSDVDNNMQQDNSQETK